MVTVIGKNNCPRCDVVVRKLESLGKLFEYMKKEEMESARFNEIMKKAMSKGLMSMPIVIKDGDIVEIKEVI